MPEALRDESFWKVLLLVIPTACKWPIKSTSGTEALMNVSLSVKLPLSTSPVSGSYHIFLEVKGMCTAITILNAQENPIVTWKPLNPYVISKHVSAFENAKNWRMEMQIKDPLIISCLSPTFSYNFQIVGVGVDGVCFIQE